MSLAACLKFLPIEAELAGSSLRIFVSCFVTITFLLRPMLGSLDILQFFLENLNTLHRNPIHRYVQLRRVNM